MEPSSVAIDLVIWARSKFLKFYVFQLTTVFCLIMFGKNFEGGGREMFLESDGTHKQPYVPLRVSSNTWMWRDKSELTLRVATCFARQHLMEVF